MTKPRILVAGIGNIFLGDDAFGCEAVQRLGLRPIPDNVRVVDFGIRGFDLAFALMEAYDAFVLVDATPRGGAPGTLYTMEVDMDAVGEPEDALVEAHSLNPVKVLSLAKSMGAEPRRVYVVGCEPTPAQDSEDEERMGLSEPVSAALDGAVAMIEAVVERIGSEKGADDEHTVESSGNYGSGRGGNYHAA
jgi:hydrogenase maturation protease